MIKMSLARAKKLVKKAVKAKGGGAKRPALPKGPNANEARFNHFILAGKGKYEEHQFEITKTKKRKYTPDFIYLSESGTLAIIEVKGNYKLGSEDRARLAWEVAAEKDVSSAVWVWARYDKGAYELEVWRCQGWAITKTRVANNEAFEKIVNGR